MSLRLLRQDHGLAPGAAARVDDDPEGLGGKAAKHLARVGVAPRTELLHAAEQEIVAAHRACRRAAGQFVTTRSGLSRTRSTFESSWPRFSTRPMAVTTL